MSLNLVLITLSTFLSTLITNLYYKKTRVPKWLKWVSLVILIFYIYPAIAMFRSGYISLKLSIHGALAQAKTLLQAVMV